MEPPLGPEHALSANTPDQDWQAMEGVTPPFYWPDTVLLNGCFRLSSFFQTILYFHTKQAAYREHVAGLARKYPGLRALFSGPAPKRRMLGEGSEEYAEGMDEAEDEETSASDDADYEKQFDELLELHKRELLDEGSEEVGAAYDEDENDDEALEPSTESPSMRKRQLRLSSASYGGALGDSSANHKHEAPTANAYSRGDIKQMKLSSALAKFARNRRRARDARKISARRNAPWYKFAFAPLLSLKVANPFARQQTEKETMKQLGHSYPTLLFHDFLSRREYAQVLEFARVIDTAGGMVVLRPRVNRLADPYYVQRLNTLAAYYKGDERC